jgi:phenylalanyl-tRNA synthetase beta chain
MKISYNWLKQYINTDLKPEALSLILTDCGLEVEGIETFESVKGGLEGIVIGLVNSKVQHPNADRLNLTTVDIGTGTDLHIVCGASNVAVGQKVLVATIGATLYPTEGDSFKIKESKIRGELSQGMICAEDELALGVSHDGIMVLDGQAPIGMEASAYLKIQNDFVFEIGLTPNRSDAMSHLGVARDIAAVLNSRENSNGETIIHWPKVENFPVTNQQKGPEILVLDPSCIRYSGVSIQGVHVKASPDWLQNSLKAIGVKPINNIVDCTNYVLHECGQPLHAFDSSSISGNKVLVKKLNSGTKFTSLDGVERTLTGDELMICNDAGGMCMAGVYGGIASGVKNETTSIFLESACFHPVSIRKSSKQHGLKTDASFRFERGTDPNNTLYALKRAAQLILETAGGEICSEIFDFYPQPVPDFKVRLSYETTNRLIGCAIEKTTIKKILLALGIVIDQETPDHLDLSIPPFKVDVQREADVIEEILRIYGYNNIPITNKLNASLIYSEKPDKEQIKNSTCEYLSSTGFYETMSLSLTKATYTENLPEFFNSADSIALLNPLSADQQVLRQTMVFSGLEVISYNKNRKNPDLKFYEFGKTYVKDGSNYKEQQHLCLFLSGRSQAEAWNQQATSTDFFELKATVSKLLLRLGIEFEEGPLETKNIFSEGLQLISKGKALVAFGQLHLSITRQAGITETVYYADFDWDKVLKALKKATTIYQEISKYPEVRRDLALLLDRERNYQELEQLAYNTEKNLLKKVNLFDVYEGEKIAAGKKSYALSFILQDDSKTLNDQQIDKIMERLIESFEKNLNAKVRQ